NGNITVTGVITGKFDVFINTSGSGAITLSGAISTDAGSGDIFIKSTTGNIVTSGSISTSGANANIEIDTATSGNVTIGGNVSTSGGDIFLGADSTSSASGTGSLTINGTVFTTGSFSGDVAIGTGGTGTVTVNKAISSDTGNIFLLAVGNQTNALNFSKDATITSGVGVVFRTTGPANTISLASGANITAVEGVTDDISGTGILNLASNINVTNPSFAVGIQLDNVSINLTGPVSMNVASTSNPSNGLIKLRNVNGAQNLTLEATGVITLLGSVGQSTPLGTVTVTNSADVNSNIGLSAASLVLTDTTGSISFSGTTVISKSLTTAAKNYNLDFSGTTTIAGNPVFLNTGATIFSGTTSFSSGATIVGNATSLVGLDGTIVSDGAFNIGVPGNTGLVDIFNNTQLILNSSSAISTIANP
ncbi:MAG: beta strand repeat-containing protein, partial [Planctomycetia bacterium]